MNKSNLNDPLTTVKGSFICYSRGRCVVTRARVKVVCLQINRQLWPTGPKASYTELFKCWNEQAQHVAFCNLSHLFFVLFIRRLYHHDLLLWFVFVKVFWRQTSNSNSPHYYYGALEWPFNWLLFSVTEIEFSIIFVVVLQSMSQRGFGTRSTSHNQCWINKCITINMYDEFYWQRAKNRTMRLMVTIIELLSSLSLLHNESMQ